MHSPSPLSSISVLNVATPTYIYPLSLHDALPILRLEISADADEAFVEMLTEAHDLEARDVYRVPRGRAPRSRSEEHTSELQSHSDLVCRLLLEKKKNNQQNEQHRPTNSLHSSFNI